MARSAALQATARPAGLRALAAALLLAAGARASRVRESLGEGKSVDQELEEAGKMPCGGKDYRVGEFLGSGAEGVVMLMNEDSAGETLGKVAKAKLETLGVEDPKDTSLGHECEVFRKLKAAGVEDTLTCLEMCTFNGRAAIVLSPVLKNTVIDVKGLDPSLQMAAVESMVKTMVAFVTSAGITNWDQYHNIMLDASTGKPWFIDMGNAEVLADVSGAAMKKQKVKFFIKGLIENQFPKAAVRDSQEEKDRIAAIITKAAETFKASTDKKFILTPAQAALSRLGYKGPALDK